MCKKAREILLKKIQLPLRIGLLVNTLLAEDVVALDSSMLTTVYRSMRHIFTVWNANRLYLDKLRKMMNDPTVRM